MQLASPRPRNRRRRTLRRELVAADAGGSFKAARFTTSHWTLNWHAHPELELTLIEHGAGLRYVGDSIEPFTSGDLVLLGPGVPHSWSNAPRPGVTCASLVVQLAADFLASDCAEARPLAALFERARRGLKLEGGTARTVRGELKALVSLRPGPERLGRLLTILGLIAAAPPREARAIARHAADPAPSAATRGSRDPWQELVRHLHEHADGPLAMAGLAARMRLSPPAFARAFRRRFAMTCTEYLTRVRLARVARELIESDQGIAGIALGAGFGNLANFNRRFRAHHGLTPREFRRQHARGGPEAG